jgi:integrase/recombinase XerD
VTESLLDLEALIPSWHLYMRSARLSPRTIATYTAGVRSFLDFCERTDTPPQLTKVVAQGWVVDLLDSGAQPATATTWLGALKRYATWLEEEGEIPANPLIGMRTPRVDRKVTNALTDDQIKALLHTCKAKTLRNRRDEAILRLLIETGMRASELVDLQTTDVNLTRGLVTVHRGKGGKGRIAPFGPQTAAATPNCSSAPTSKPSATGRWLRPCAAVPKTPVSRISTST